MSDLAAANCGCGGCERTNNSCSCIWILFLLMLCGNNDGCGCTGSSFFGNDTGGCGCNALIWILLLSCCCNGGTSGFFC